MTTDSMDTHSEGDVDSDNPLLGMMLMTISALLHTTLNMSVKTLMYETAWQELMFVRMGITWILSVLWIIVVFRGEINFCGPSSTKFRILLLVSLDTFTFDTCSKSITKLLTRITL